MTPTIIINIPYASKRILCGVSLSFVRPIRSSADGSRVIFIYEAEKRGELRKRKNK